MLQGDLFTRLSLDQSLRRVFSVYKSGFLLFTKIAAVVCGANTLLWALVLLPLLLSAFDLSSEEVKDPLFSVMNPAAFLALLGANVVLGCVVGAIASGSMVRAVAEVYTGRRPEWLECLAFGVKKAPTLMLASFLALLGIVVGYFFLFAPGLYLAVAWFVYAPAIVLENLSAHRSLGRSHELVSGEWCYVFCTFLVVAIFMMVLQFVWSYVLLGGADGGHTLFSIKGSIVAQIPTLVVTPIFAIMQTVMYFNLRVEKEGLNAELLLRGMGVSSDESAGYRPVTLDSEESPNADADSSAADAA